MAKPFHLAWFLQGSSVQAWGEAWTGHIGNSWMQPTLFLDMARSLERACFDYILLEDSSYVGESFNGSTEVYLKNGLSVPRQDPSVVAALMTQVTSRIGIVPTFGTFAYPPYLLARLVATLDQVSAGRIGWNAVTGSSDVAAMNFGLGGMPEHDLRYDMADEYMDLVHKLWRSWDPDAVLLDREKGVFADPDKVREVDFKGQWYSSRGPLPMCASPQVSPVIFQAGGSGRGRDFAAQHAECILSNQNSTKGMKDYVDDVEQRAAKLGQRRPRVLFSIQPIVGDTPEAARERERAHLALAQSEPYLNAGLAFASMSLGMDLSKLDLDTPVGQQLDKLERSKKGESIQHQYFKSRPDTTPRDMGLKEAVKVTIPIVGTAEQVADRMCEIVDETGAGGFMIREAFLPSYINDIVDRVVPALQRRGAFRKEYSGRTFREHIYEY